MAGGEQRRTTPGGTGPGRRHQRPPLGLWGHGKNDPPKQDDDLGAFGYDFEVRDVIVLGITARALAYTAPGRVQIQSVESHGRSEAVPAGAIADASRYLLAMFRQRLDEERAQILLRHPIQPHRTR